MSASQQLRILGTPLEIMNILLEDDRKILEQIFSDRVRMGLEIQSEEVEMIIRFFLSRARKSASQAILDAYSLGRLQAFQELEEKAKKSSR